MVYTVFGTINGMATQMSVVFGKNTVPRFSLPPLWRGVRARRGRGLLRVARCTVRRRQYHEEPPLHKIADTAFGLARYSIFVIVAWRIQSFQMPSNGFQTSVNRRYSVFPA